MVRRPHVGIAGRLDVFLREFDFEQLRCRWIEADPDEVWRGLMEVRPIDLALARRWTIVRGKPLTPGLLSVLAGEPQLMLAHEQNRFAVYGLIERPGHHLSSTRNGTTIDEFIRFDEPCWIKRLTGFELSPSGNGTRLCVTTRVARTDPVIRRWRKLRGLLDRPRASVAQRNVLDAVGRLAG